MFLMLNFAQEHLVIAIHLMQIYQNRNFIQNVNQLEKIFIRKISRTITKRCFIIDINKLNKMKTYLEKNYNLKGNTEIKNLDDLISYLNENFIPYIESFVYENFKINTKFGIPIMQINQMGNSDTQIFNYFLITDDIPINDLKILVYAPSTVNISVFLAFPISCSKTFKYPNEIEFDIEFDFKINETAQITKIKKVSKKVVYNISENFFYINKKN